MKVAVPIFRNGVSPRIDIADSLLIYDIDGGIVKSKEKCPLQFDQPAELISFLQEKEIEKVVCGGCPQFFSRMLYFYGFEVLPGLTGEPEHIIKMLLNGKFASSPSNEPLGRGRRRCRSRQSGRGKMCIDNKSKKKLKEV